MELPHFKEIIYGQVLAKANYYMAVPGNRGLRRIIKDEPIRQYEQLFQEQSPHCIWN